MNRIHYYPPSQKNELVIQAIIPRVLTWGEFSSAGVNSFSLGAYVLSQNLNVVPVSNGQMIDKFTGYHRTLQTTEFVASLKSLATNHKLWETVAQEKDIFNYFEKQKKKGVNTFQFLVLSYFYLKNKQDIPGQLSAGVRHFYSQFERSGHIYQLYDNDFKPLTKSINNIYNYVSLSIVLSLLYARTSYLPYLNTALKINDMYPEIISFVDSSDKAILILTAIYLLNYHLEIFYDSRKFRLPLDR